MARALKYVVPFKSYNNKACSIQIYAEGYTGNPIALTTGNPTAPGYAAADPFFFEENKDKDVLTPIRSSTGYIRLVEMEHGSLDDILPSSMFDRYVEVFYGSAKVWFGFIQQKEFSNRFSGAPFLREFPIISPLGLAEEVYFPSYDPPRPITFKELMYEVMTLLNVTYTGVVMPATVSVDGLDTPVADLDASTSTLTVCPFNSEHSYAEDNDEPLFSPHTLAWFLEGLCNLYGFTVREVWDYAVNSPSCRLLFTSFNYEGGFVIYPVVNNTLGARNSMTNLSGGDSDTLSDTLEMADNSAKLSAINALKEVEYEYDGETSIEETHEFNRDSFAAIQSDTASAYAYLQPYAEALGSQILQTSGFPSYTIPSTGVSDLVLGGNDDVDHKVLYGYSSAHASSTVILWQGFFKSRNVSRVLRMKMQWGQPTSLGNEELANDLEFAIQITARSKYSSTAEHYLVIDSHGQWLNSWQTQQSGQDTLVKIDKTTGEMTIGEGAAYNGIHIPATPTKFQNVFVSIRTTANSNLSQQSWYSIELTMSDNRGNGLGDIVHYSDRFSEKIALAETGSSKRIAQNFASKIYAVNRIVQDSGYAVGIQTPTVLSATQNRLECKFRLKDSASPLGMIAYVHKQLFWQTDWHWRILALRFNPWNDEYTLTLHRSTTI